MSSVIRGVLFIFVLLGCHPMPAGAQQHGDIRLASDGRVEFFDGIEGWGSICSTGWDDNDAKVVCRQLKEDTSNVKASSVLDSKDRYWWPQQVHCLGDEERLTECSITEFVTDECEYLSSRAAVKCGKSMTEKKPSAANTPTRTQPATRTSSATTLVSKLFTTIIAGIAAGCLMSF